MATIDGFFAKTNKAQGMNYLIKDADNVYTLRPDPNERPSFKTAILPSI